MSIVSRSFSAMASRWAERRLREYDRCCTSSMSWSLSVRTGRRGDCVTRGGTISGFATVTAEGNGNFLITRCMECRETQVEVTPMLASTLAQSRTTSA